MGETLGMPNGSIMLPGGLDPGMSDPSKQPQLSIQQKMELMSRLLKIGGGETGSMMGGGGGGGTGSAARTPGIPNPQPINLPQGSMAAAVQPQSSQPMPQASGALGNNVQPPQNTGANWQFASPKARNAAVVSNAIQSFSQLAQGIHQKKFEQAVAESSQIWQTYLQKTKALEMAKQSGDPEQIKAAGQDLQQFAQDKKVAKVLQTISDPKKALSPQSIGVQRAMKASQEQAVQQAELEKTQAQAKAEQSRAAQEDATAAWRRKQTEMVGKETDEQRSKQTARHQDVKTVVDAMVQRSQDTIKAQGERLVKQLASTEKVASAHDATLMKIAKIREGDKDIDNIAKEANSLSEQVKNLNAETKEVLDGINKNPWTSWFNGDKAAAEAKLANIDGRRQMLQKQQEIMTQKWIAMYASGKINIDPSAATQAPPGSEKSGEGDVSNEDFMKLLDQQNDASKGSQYNEN